MNFLNSETLGKNKYNTKNVIFGGVRKKDANDEEKRAKWHKILIIFAYVILTLAAIAGIIIRFTLLKPPEMKPYKPEDTKAEDTKTESN